MSPISNRTIFIVNAFINELKYNKLARTNNVLLDVFSKNLQTSYPSEYKLIRLLEPTIMNRTGNSHSDEEQIRELVTDQSENVLLQFFGFLNLPVSTTLITQLNILYPPPTRNDMRSIWED